MIEHLEEYGAMLRITESCRLNATLKAAHEACDFLVPGRLLDLKGPDYSLTLGCGLRAVILSDPFDVAAKLLAVEACPNPRDFSQSAALSLTVEKGHMGLSRYRSYTRDWVGFVVAVHRGDHSSGEERDAHRNIYHDQASNFHQQVYVPLMVTSLIQV